MKLLVVSLVGLAIQASCYSQDWKTLDGAQDALGEGSEIKAYSDPGDGVLSLDVKLGSGQGSYTARIRDFFSSEDFWRGSASESLRLMRAAPGTIGREEIPGYDSYCTWSDNAMLLHAGNVVVLLHRRKGTNISSLASLHLVADALQGFVSSLKKSSNFPFPSQ